jgi:hypothetical protein
MNILDALTSPALFGSLPAFESLSSWSAWLVFLKAVYGLPMTQDEVAIFRARTGRQEPRANGYPEAVAIVGCQSGKSQVAAIVGTYEAAQALAAGASGLYVPLIAQDARGAQRALLAYVRQAVDASPVLQHEVTRETADTVELGGGSVTVGVYPCRPASVRGIRAACLIVDELAFFTSTDGNPVDVEMLRACRSRVATTGGKLLILSSPYGQTGALWDLHHRHFGREDSTTLVWQASAPQMNPLLPADYLAKMEADDPEAYRSEVLGEFRAGIATLFDPAVLDAVVSKGVHEVAPVAGTSYSAHYDASGGRVDAAALAVGHVEAGTRLVRVDLVRRWPSPHNPDSVIHEAALVLRPFGVRSVQVDRFAGEFPIAAFRREGIRAEVAARTTSEHHLALLPLVNAGRVVILDQPELLKELRGLERRTGPGGRDHADHRRGAHDDAAAAVSGVAALLAKATAGRPRRMFNAFTGETKADWRTHLSLLDLVD